MIWNKEVTMILAIFLQLQTVMASMERNRKIRPQLYDESVGHLPVFWEMRYYLGHIGLSYCWLLSVVLMFYLIYTWMFAEYCTINRLILSGCPHQRDLNTVSFSSITLTPTCLCLCDPELQYPKMCSSALQLTHLCAFSLHHAIRSCAVYALRTVFLRIL